MTSETAAIIALSALFLAPAIVAMLFGRFVAMLVCLAISGVTVWQGPYRQIQSEAVLALSIILQIVIISVAVWADKMLKAVSQRSPTIPTERREPEF